jgi:hypothetical protein
MGIPAPSDGQVRHATGSTAWTRPSGAKVNARVLTHHDDSEAGNKLYSAFHSWSWCDGAQRLAISNENYTESDVSRLLRTARRKHPAMVIQGPSARLLSSFVEA